MRRFQGGWVGGGVGGGEERATRRPDEYIDVRFCHFLDLGFRNLMAITAITLILRSIWLLFIFCLEVRCIRRCVFIYVTR